MSMNGAGHGDADDASLFALLSRELRRFSTVVGWPEHDPDDLVQEAVARALLHGPLGRLENPGAYLRTTIIRITANRSRGRLLRTRVHRTLSASTVSQ